MLSGSLLDAGLIEVAAMGRSPGRHGGTMRMLMGDQRDIRMMTIYGYTRLVVYDDKLELAPDVLESYEAELREGAGHAGPSALIDLIARKPAAT